MEKINEAVANAMPKTTKAAGSIQKAAAAKVANKSQEGRSIKQWISAYMPEISKALPSVITPERFARICTTAVTRNQKLAECTPSSFIGAMLTAAQLGLEPNSALGQAWIIPYWNKELRAYEAQFQIGYKGLITMCYRSGMVATIDAQEVHENDFFEYELGLEPKLKHIPARSDRGKVTEYYGVWKGKDGGYGFAVMSMEDVKRHKEENSKATGFSPWSNHFDAMAKKTVLTKALKYAPLSSEFQRQAATDNTIRSFDPASEEHDMIDLQPDYTFNEETGEMIETGAESTQES